MGCRPASATGAKGHHAGVGNCVTRRAQQFAGSGLLLTLAASVVSGCTLGDGEGPRYKGRVISVTSEQICLGPNSSSPNRPSCGRVPPGVTELPQVGECVSLFGRSDDGWKTMTWSEESLRLKVEDSTCAARQS